MTRKDYVKQCITSATFLVGGCKDETQYEYIFLRANDMMSSAWQVEYKLFTRLKTLQSQKFWGDICHELELEGLVHRCYAHIGNKGNVEIRVIPNNSVTTCIFRLKK